jgi:2-keto-3-deoxy-L-rhamnonate aldolase RhmA
MHNPLQQKLLAGKTVKLMSLRLSHHIDVVQMLKVAGFDGFYIDAEHGMYSLRDISELCQMAHACGLTPWVRVHSATVGAIGPVLDAGALGIILPHVNNPQEAAQAVSLCRYPPLGHRSMAALGPPSAYQRLPAKESFAQRNAAVMVVAMIETQAGLDQAQAIAAVPGVDALMMGPMDLSLELGIPGELRHPRILAAYDISLKAAMAAGKHFVCGDAGGPPVAQLVAHGARVLLGSNDANYLLQALSQAAQSLEREALGSTH